MVIVIWNKIWETSFAKKATFKFCFRTKPRFHWRRNPSKKVVTVEEELDGTDADGIRNLIALPRLMFIGEK